jgi:hypothetical protein
MHYYIISILFRDVIALPAPRFELAKNLKKSQVALDPAAMLRMSVKLEHA